MCFLLCYNFVLLVSIMDFARKQLLKYGWSDGKGLGKNENGISEALKPKLKRSVTGVGYDAASDFTEHWWSQLYDKAAGNVEVEEKNGKTKKIKTKGSDNFEITTSTWRLSKKKKVKDGVYSEHFVRKSILTNGGGKVENVTDSESEGEIEKKDVFKMTDEELFAACGGRTAHKGARHGLKALGKLARIAQQEQMLLTQSRFNGYSHAKKLKQDISVNDLQVVEDMNLNSDADEPIVKKRKKKRKRCVSQNSALGSIEKNICNLAELKEIPMPDQMLEKKLEIVGVASGAELEKFSRKLKKSKSKSVIQNEVCVVIVNDSNKSKENKKRKDCHDGDNVSFDKHETDDESQIVKKCKKKKRNTVA